MQIIVGLVRPGFQDFRFNDWSISCGLLNSSPTFLLFSFDLLSNGQNWVYWGHSDVSQPNSNQLIWVKDDIWAKFWEIHVFSWYHELDRLMEKDRHAEA